MGSCGCIDPTRPEPFGPEFGSEQPLHLPVCMFASIEERDELLRRVAPIHVDGEQTGVLSADVVRQALQLLPVIIPGHAVAFNECLDAGSERYDAI